MLERARGKKAHHLGAMTLTVNLTLVAPLPSQHIRNNMLDLLPVSQSISKKEHESTAASLPLGKWHYFSSRLLVVPSNLLDACHRQQHGHEEE